MSWVERLSEPKKKNTFGNKASDENLFEIDRFYDCDTALGKSTISTSVKHSPLKYRSFSPEKSSLKKLSIDEIPSEARHTQAHKSHVLQCDKFPRSPELDPYQAFSYERRCQQWIRDPKRGDSKYTSVCPRFSVFGRSSQQGYYNSRNLSPQNLQDQFRFHKAPGFKL